MKKLHYLVLIAIAFIVSNCDTNDDRFYNEVSIEATNLVTLDAHSTIYSVGEKLYVNADFSRYLNDNGIPLDAYRTTNATQFFFSYVIEKQINATTWESVVVNDNQLDIVKGIAQSDIYVYGICQYNPTDESYEYRVGFPLLSSGTYRLSWGYNSDSKTSVELRSISSARNLFLNINWHYKYF